jgi:hypothetical protein
MTRISRPPSQGPAALHRPLAALGFRRVPAPSQIAASLRKLRPAPRPPALNPRPGGQLRQRKLLQRSAMLNCPWHQTCIGYATCPVTDGTEPRHDRPRLGPRITRRAALAAVVLAFAPLARLRTPQVRGVNTLDGRAAFRRPLLGYADLGDPTAPRLTRTPGRASRPRSLRMRPSTAGAGGH